MRICPRCKGILGERPALSRRDGKTDICSQCGLLEALEDVEKLKVPIVINVLEGDITSYYVGTIDDKEVLTEDEELELYNIYSNGIHEVLQDACDERC